MRRYLEDAEAAALMAWAKRQPYNGRCIADYLFAVPNGGKRNVREAARFKRMGVRAGIPDYFLHVVKLTHESITPCGGLWIELKAEGGRLSTEQHAQLSHLRICGYATCVAYGWLEAAERIREYLK